MFIPFFVDYDSCRPRHSRVGGNDELIYVNEPYYFVLIKQLWRKAKFR